MTSVTVSFGYIAAVWRLTPMRGLSASALGRDVQAEDRRRAAVLDPQALEDLDGRRLAGAVRARAGRRPRRAATSKSMPSTATRSP